jgi:sugar phosphate isomerase/epimerase
MHRRKFLQTAGAIAALPQASRAQAAPGAGILLGFDTYSLRAFHWKDIQLVDYAAQVGADTVQISDSGDYASLDPAHLAEVRDHAARAGIRIDAGIGCICPLSKSWNEKDGPAARKVVDGLKVAKAVGARSMRCFMGSSADRRGERPIEALMEATIAVFRSVRSQAQDLGVKIALENHAGDMQAREVRTIIEESGKDFVASCLDTGNPMWVMEHPMVTLEILGPYAVTTHVRDSAVFEHPRGAAAQWVALGDGNVDWHAFLALYQKLCPDALLQLEIITGRPPLVLPYYKREWWRWFPKTPASEFVRFQQMARNGAPFMGTMVIEDAPGSKPTEFAAALREQQRTDLERSIEYAKKQLGLGVRWKNSPAA